MKKDTKRTKAMKKKKRRKKDALTRAEIQEYEAIELKTPPEDSAQISGWEHLSDQEFLEINLLDVFLN